MSQKRENPLVVMAAGTLFLLLVFGVGIAFGAELCITDVAQPIQGHAADHSRIMLSIIDAQPNTAGAIEWGVGYGAPRSVISVDLL